MKRKAYIEFKNGEKSVLPFSENEYFDRLSKLRKIMNTKELDAVVLTSMHNIAYFSGFLYCSFGRNYAFVVTKDTSTTISANIDGGQPWRRSIGENLIYTDWEKNNFWRAVKKTVAQKMQIGIEEDHLNIENKNHLESFVNPQKTVDVSKDIMKIRMIKSQEELELIRLGAKIADIGGKEIINSVKVGISELEIAMIGRNAMEKAISFYAPNSEIRDTWVWFQSGLNTDGAHNPVTTKKIQNNEILSLNTFPMISGYYTALERTLWKGEPDGTSLKLWEANVEAHELGISLIKSGIKCSEICSEINRFFEEKNLLKYRSFGYGHSFGILSHYYGREAGLELREDIDTVLEPGMVISMEPMLTIPNSEKGAGGYREHDIIIIQNEGIENITKTPYGPNHNIL